MLDARRRPVGRLFFGLVSVLLIWWSIAQVPMAVADPDPAPDPHPATTRVSDTVYRADGTPASGTVLISWPTFTTSDSKPVAAATKGVTLGTGGSLAVDLVPNVGATPAGAYYAVVFQLEGAVRTEYWLVGATSPTTISAVAQRRDRARRHRWHRGSMSMRRSRPIRRTWIRQWRWWEQDRLSRKMAMP